MDSQQIISRLPYVQPFLFVDEILSVDENSISGKFKFSEELSFFAGHFKDNPIVPGVILIETMAQIGVAWLGIYLTKESAQPKIAMTSVEAEFLNPVYPNDVVTVRSTKKYFRFGKLKCVVSMHNENELQLATAVISGMIVT